MNELQHCDVNKAVIIVDKHLNNAAVNKSSVDRLMEKAELDYLNVRKNITGQFQGDSSELLNRYLSNTWLMKFV